MRRISATEQQALQSMRNSPWNTEALMVDTATEVLVASGNARKDAETIAQAVFDRHFKITGAN